MTVFTIRIVNTNKFYGRDNYIYAFKYKYQAYKVIRKWFIRKQHIADNIIQIDEHSINDLPSHVDIWIPAHRNKVLSHGDFKTLPDIKKSFEKLMDL